jgi:hypothetical protein
LALSLFRTIATAAHARLTTILTSEGRATPDLVFGNVPLEELDTSRRIAWFQDGGRIVLDPLPELASEEDDEPPTSPIAVRRATCRIGIWAPAEDEVEHVCDRLMLACRQLDGPPAYSQLFHWADASYDYPSQMIGAPLKNGVHVITLRVPLDLPVAGVPDGATELVTVEGHQLRVGIANPPTEADATVQFDVNRWTG